ncbi:hypothetical protein [Rhizobium ruizarguesonis]|uniref:hypothetical protein n=1 Tax=Rhizobium ruizarguesonis TaxID=2081791 RepID=UPI0010305FCD|nr:hypothetical protein [Rhizobium ruizarguesonis]TAV14469.1 hypothetical protein ELI34_02785 [Rhizobium ruizarguesonis]TAV26979.1 hypothetical protein ELI35_04365 [Rhizobium ruizarguesonis]TAW70949.1 hypothetical protein ELI16_02700 [Rhizobium ruizarguesonis]TAW92293.1 hypothetical protein ELI11_02785 [Rhizobium ruizarguesonis]TAY45572.1 hypothetical protein ELH87_02800 [Rhizobium ruizarguesonis]
MDESCEVDSSTLVSGGKASECFRELKYLSVAMLVDDRIMRDDDLSEGFLGYDRLGLHLRNCFPQGIAVTGFIGQNGLTCLVMKKSGRLRGHLD